MVIFQHSLLKVLFRTIVYYYRIQTHHIRIKDVNYLKHHILTLVAAIRFLPRHFSPPIAALAVSYRSALRTCLVYERVSVSAIKDG